MRDVQAISSNMPPLELVLELSFYVLLGFYAIFTAIVYYHWTTYATEKTVSRITLLSYVLSTLPLLLVMGGIVLIV
jgi:hypothetical protein